jgi:uncharacterized protein YggE
MSKRLRTPSLALLAAAVAVALVLGAGAGSAAAATTGRLRTITVVGTGEVRGTPDVADLALGVSGRGATAADVLRTIADRAQKVIDVLHEAGVADEDIQTSDLSVQPVYDDHDRITGYEATNTVTARIRDLGKAGGIVDAAADQAGDSIRVQGITFSIDDDSKLLAAARTKATKRARAQAEQLAGGAEVEVGEVQSISETTTAVPLTSSGEAADRAARTPVQPGSQVLSVSATVVFALR